MGVGKYTGGSLGLASQRFNVRLCLRNEIERDKTRYPMPLAITHAAPTSTPCTYVPSLPCTAQKRRKKEGKMDLWNSTRFRQAGLLGHSSKGGVGG